MIFFLLFINIVLAGVLAARGYGRQADARRERADLSALLSSAGLDIGQIALPTNTSPVLDVARDFTAEQAALASLDGGAVTSVDLGGGSVELTGQSWSARFRAGGDWDATPSEPRPAPSPVTLCAGWARTMGFWTEASDPEFSFEDGTLRLPARLGGLTVWDGYLSFHLRGAAVVGISGRWPLGETAAAGSTCMSAGWALLSLAGALNEQGVTPGTLHSVELGYRSELISAGTLRLTPYWRVELTAGQYYISAVTGAYEREDMMQTKAVSESAEEGP